MSQVTNSGVHVTSPGAPTAATYTATGSLGAGAYRYKITYVTAFGETAAGTASNSVTPGAGGSAQLTGIPTWSDKNVLSRNIYRTASGGSTYALLASINDNTTTTYIDTVADASLGVAAPVVSTADSLQIIKGYLNLGQPICASFERAITAGAGGTTAAAYQLSSEYSFVSTVATANDGVKLWSLNANLVGSHAVIRNDGANTARVFPYTGQTINGGAADSPITVAAGASVELVATTASNWAQAR